MSQAKEEALNYRELSHFLLRESIKLSDDFLFYIREEDGPAPFYMAGPDYILKMIERIQQYLKYAALAFKEWEKEDSEPN